jgi:hypothetical protein
LLDFLGELRKVHTYEGYVCGYRLIRAIALRK